jgi:centromere protein I
VPLAAVVAIVRKPTYLDQSTVTQLIKNLYPANPVGADVIYDVVSCIGSGSARPSMATQALLLQWLLLVREALAVDGDVALGKCYSALFNQLQALGTRYVRLCRE